MDTVHRLVVRADDTSPGSHRNASNSLSSIVWTLVPTALIALAFLALFFILRTKQKRVYTPRTYLDNLYEHQRTTGPESLGRFNWIKGYAGLGDDYILTHQSLDGFLYVRFFKILAFICLVGCCMLWPVLFPINATGHGGQEQLDILSMANVADIKRFYAHAIMAWVFLGFVIAMITRETIYWINLRQAYLLTPRIASRMSSRTVLFTSVPDGLLSEPKLRQEFEGVRRTWIVTDTKELEDLVDDRDKTAMKLEGAEVKLQTMANKNRIKAEKKGNHPVDNETGDIAARWVPAKKRPTHRLKPLIGKKVDTIEYSRTHIDEVEPQVESLQASHREVVSEASPIEAAAETGEKKHSGLKAKIPGLGGKTGQVKLQPAVFIEFHTQRQAQNAFNTKPRHLPGKMQARTIASTPEDVIWSNMKKKRPERLIRTVICTSIVCAMIIFWAIPVAFVGILSNVNALTDKITFLSFINKIPNVVLGAVTGLLPVVLLAVLMSLVPIFCRLLAKQTGLITYSRVELKTQTWYFWFQVIQVFLITTMTSGASSVGTKIFQQPGQAPKLLSENLPKASNFYISYFLLFGLSTAASTLLNLMPLIWFNILSPILDKTPRKKFNRYIRLAGLQWGSVVPKFALLGVIAITYSIIAPLVLGFATIGIYLLYLAFRYCFFYTMTTRVDTHGAFYGKALGQLMVGVYLAELCLIGLFAIDTASSLASLGPLIIVAVLFGLTIIYHIYMKMMLKPFCESLDQDLMIDSEREQFGSHSIDDTNGHGRLSGATNVGHVDSNGEKNGTRKPKPTRHLKTGGLFKRWLFNGSSSSYPKIVGELRGSILSDRVRPYTSKEERDAYFNPAITSERPTLWIVRDPMGISRQQIAETSKVIPISDEYAGFDEKGKIRWESENVTRAPIWEDRPEY